MVLAKDLHPYLMKTLEQLFLNLLRPQVHHAEDAVEDVIRYLLHRAHSNLA